MQRHRFDLISFLFGLFFGGIGLWVIAIEEGFDPDLGAWLWPALLIAGGTVVLTSALGGGQKPDDPVVADGPLID